MCVCVCVRVCVCVCVFVYMSACKHAFVQARVVMFRIMCDSHLTLSTMVGVMTNCVFSVSAVSTLDGREFESA